MSALFTFGGGLLGFFIGDDFESNGTSSLPPLDLGFCCLNGTFFLEDFWNGKKYKIEVAKKCKQEFVNMFSDFKFVNSLYLHC